ncbi:hypothetical protein R7V41_01990 [Mesomycoplasma ovipneumoniae]|uniref:Uncharacterized protein n=1 Tax=Mesomycoplasma ovipneumoniae TaxID=29562 RepID=A0AAJ2P9P5_9BACT|nr:hypothetical protein [Mesomycoplasma ovipneumoniae]MDW2906389.1 hypothetical protein [Mesomycoplasma ovipneumoniae]MDW2914289.1 hypothetical protein [Mesomycoplasma ovipneumoniae]
MVDTNLIVVIALLTTLIIGFLAYGFISNRLKLRRLKIEKAELKELSNKTLAIFLARIIVIIEKNIDLVSNFVVGANLKMSDVNNLARVHLEVLQNDQVVSQIIQTGYETEKIFFNNINILSKSKSNLWTKHNSKEINYFTDFASYLKKYDKTILGLFNDEKIRFLKYYSHLIADLKQKKFKLTSSQH